MSRSREELNAEKKAEILKSVDTQKLKTDLMESIKQYLAHTSGVKQVVHHSGRAAATELQDKLNKAGLDLITILRSTWPVISDYSGDNTTIKAALIKVLLKYIPLDEKEVIRQAAQEFYESLKDKNNLRITKWGATPAAGVHRSVIKKIKIYSQAVEKADDPSAIPIPQGFELEMSYAKNEIRISLLAGTVKQTLTTLQHMPAASNHIRR